MLRSFPFPQRSDISVKEIYAHGHNLTTFEEYNNDYQRKVSKEASSIKNQYLSIEQEMLNAFQYVHPTMYNKSTTSVRFATIIRESSNLFEIISRNIYKKIFVDPKISEINIKNFLSLDAFINLSEGILSAPTLQDEFSNSDILQPFKSLEGWDRNSLIMDDHIPRWWKSYNKLKHDVLGIQQYATFENALLSLGAIYLTISRVYGEGVVGGILRPVYVSFATSTFVEQLVPVSKLFIEETDLKSTAVFG